MKVAVLLPDGSRADLDIAGTGSEVIVHRGDVKADVRVLSQSGGELVFEIEGRVHHARVAAVPDGWSVQLRGRETRFREASSGHAGGDGSSARAEPVLRATLPGRVLRVLVATGAAVRAGDTLLVIEAMKMENPVEAPADGTVETLLVAEGEMVQVGQDLVSLDYGPRPPPEASS